MSSITLRAISEDNFDAVVGLKVKPGQEGFVASNVYSLAQAYLFKDFVPRAIYNVEETPVGFVMWGRLRKYWAQGRSDITPDDIEDDAWMIFRLMVAADQQGKGYGKAATLAALAELKMRPDVGVIYISFEPENTLAAALYRRVGFADTGRIAFGEVLYRMAVP